MPQAGMQTVFTCDVSENRRRHRIARLPEEESTRVRKPVFQPRMSSTRAGALDQRIAGLLGDGDGLRVCAADEDGLSRSRVYGDAAPFETEEGCWVV